MGKIKLNPLDEIRLQNAITEFAKELEHIGINGKTNLYVGDSGDIHGTFQNREGVMIFLSICEDGDRVMKEYL